VVPVIGGETYWEGLRRIDVGGKLLTNYLKETVSFRHYNMMEETFLMNVVKEATCFVSQDFAADIEEVYINKRKSMYVAAYVLPDYRTSTIGHVLEQGESEKDHQVLRLTNERFTVPELLFKPDMLSIGQAGIAETVMQTLDGLSAEEQSLLLANVVLVGGTSKLPGYEERVYKELRSFAPQDTLVRVSTPTDPITHAWDGGSRLGRASDKLDELVVSRKEYQEHGSNICISRFGPPDDEPDD
jgi:actin-related protein 6